MGITKKTVSQMDGYKTCEVMKFFSVTGGFQSAHKSKSRALLSVPCSSLSWQLATILVKDLRERRDHVQFVTDVTKNMPITLPELQNHESPPKMWQRHT